MKYRATSVFYQLHFIQTAIQYTLHKVSMQCFIVSIHHYDTTLVALCLTVPWHSAFKRLFLVPTSISISITSSLGLQSSTSNSCLCLLLITLTLVTISNCLLSWLFVTFGLLFFHFFYITRGCFHIKALKHFGFHQVLEPSLDVCNDLGSTKPLLSTNSCF